MSYDTKLDSLVDSLEYIDTPEKTWDFLFEYTKGLAAEAMTYCHFAPPGAQDFNEKFSVAHGFDPENLIDYKRSCAQYNNPFEDRTLPLNQPIFWSNLETEIEFSEEHLSALKKFYFNKHLNGLVIPVHGPNNRNGCINLRFEDPDVKHSKTEVRKLQLASQYAHQTFCRLHSENRKNPTTLTTREQEILTWVARGKSNSVIAEIVGISQHTVNGYLRRIYLKTGTSDRTTASLRAIGEALINY